MSFPKASLLLALLLILSIGGKAAATSGDPQPNPSATLEAVRQMLADQGFEARVRQLRRSPGVILQARSSGCNLIAGEYPVHDTFADVYRNMASNRGELRFVFRGALHDEPPKLRSMWDFFLWRELRRIGVDAPRAPVIALIRSPGCAAHRLPWRQAAFVES